MDDTKERKWTILIFENAQSKSAKVDGPKFSRSENRRSLSMKVDGLKQLRWKVSKFRRVTEDGLKVDGL